MLDEIAWSSSRAACADHPPSDLPVRQLRLRITEERANQSSGKSHPRIALVCDEPIARLGLEAVLRKEIHNKPAVSSGRFEDAIATLTDQAADITIVSVRYGHSTFSKASIRRSLLALRRRSGVVIALVRPTERRNVAELSTLGVVSIELDAEAIPNLVAALAGGAAAEAQRSKGKTLALPSPQPTGRQLQVLRLLASGCTNRQIAQSLRISPATAKFHVGNLMRAFSATRRWDLVHNATLQGFI